MGDNAFVSEATLDGWVRAGAAVRAGSLLTTDDGRRFSLRDAVRVLGRRNGDTDPYGLTGRVEAIRDFVRRGASISADALRLEPGGLRRSIEYGVIAARRDGGLGEQGDAPRLSIPVQPTHVGGQPVEDAVDEGAAVLAAEALGELGRLVEDDGARHLAALEQPPRRRGGGPRCGRRGPSRSRRQVEVRWPCGWTRRPDLVEARSATPRTASVGVVPALRGRRGSPRQ